MAFALWVVGAFVFIVYFGTWALQIAVILLQITLRLTGWLAMILFGLMSILALAFFDRKQLVRIWRNERVHAGNAALLGRERRG